MPDQSECRLDLLADLVADTLRKPLRDESWAIPFTVERRFMSEQDVKALDTAAVEVLGVDLDPAEVTPSGQVSALSYGVRLSIMRKVIPVGRSKEEEEALLRELHVFAEQVYRRMLNQSYCNQESGLAAIFRRIDLMGPIFVTTLENIFVSEFVVVFAMALSELR